MKVALVVIGRLENRYAIEYIEYYKKLKFDDIFIIDNNNDGDEYFEDVLQPYINDNFVHIINYRNIHGLKIKNKQLISTQVLAYLDLYKKINKDYDWLAFFDFDEFIALEKDNDIKEYLSRECFNDYNQILLNWKTYTDNNLIYDENKPCLERFTTPMQFNKRIQYSWCGENNHTKPIIRSCINNLDMYSPHLFYNDLLSDTICSGSGKKLNLANMYQFWTQTLDYDLAYVKHFTTKSLEEFINIKFKRGTGDRDMEMFYKTYPIEKYFKYNDITPEKLDYLEKHGFNIDNLEERVNKWNLD